MSETNFNKVVRWMKFAEQEVPENIKLPASEILKLRKELIREESEECLKEFDVLIGKKLGIWAGSDTDPLAHEMLNLIKELADILVVVYGAFAAIGVNGDEVFSIVMRNNFGKIEKGFKRDDGKLVVDAETKMQLKLEVNDRLKEMLGGTH